MNPVALDCPAHLEHRVIRVSVAKEVHCAGRCGQVDVAELLFMIRDFFVHLIAGEQGERGERGIDGVGRVGSPGPPGVQVRLVATQFVCGRSFVRS